ncbi:MAG: SRPBCC family protein [bacterium]|nr:SRPBCC family protein [bacterium]
MGQCYNSIVVDAPVEKVWATVKRFHDFSWAPNVITSVEVIGDKAEGEIGARRKLNDAFLETLTELNEGERTCAYTIDDGPGPVASDVVERYVGRVRVLPVTATGQTFVLWTSEYSTNDDSAVGEFCNPIYHALLNALAASFQAAKGAGQT